ncbi:MAG: PhzF family phenazine biosynthesis protein [Candidatus Krumholzibacteriota bacterium]|nr:PhzF family phenazine biosynthesis protein [Candidatus Krumholzibacteriota bacterium]
MHSITLKRIDAFTTKPFSGNPAGVITEADGLSSDTMQQIASEMKMNIIELAFITSPSSPGADFRIRFFTPSRELPYSGHVLIAACYALIEEGRIDLQSGPNNIIFETMLSEFPVTIYFDVEQRVPSVIEGQGDGVMLTLPKGVKGTLKRIMMQSPLNKFHPCTIPPGEIAEVLGIKETEINTPNLPLVISDSDLYGLIIPLKSKETIQEMHPDLIRLGMLNKKYGIDINHVFSLDTYHSESTTYSRFFGPAIGLWEDPASASASAILGQYLTTYGLVSSGYLILEQGKEIECLTRILVEIEKTGDEISTVRVGGLAVNSIERNIDLNLPQSVPSLD